MKNQPTHTPPKQTLEELQAQLERHTWAMECETHPAFWKAMRIETRLFKQVQAHDGKGVELFRNAFTSKLRELRAVSFESGMRQADEQNKNIIQYLKRENERLREKYMTPLDKFKEKLELQDWFYSFSDDVGVWRSGEESVKRLVAEAEKAGPEFVAALRAKQQEISDQIKNGGKKA